MTTMCHCRKAQTLEAWRQRIAALFAGDADDAITRVCAPAQAISAARGGFSSHHRRHGNDARADRRAAAASAHLYAIVSPLPSADYRFAVSAIPVPRPGGGLCFGPGFATHQYFAGCPGNAQRGRLYLPYEYLVEEYVPVTVPEALQSPQLPLVCAKLAVLADRYFAQAEAAMRLAAAAQCAPRNSWRQLPSAARILRASNLPIRAACLFAEIQEITAGDVFIYHDR